MDEVFAAEEGAVGCRGGAIPKQLADRLEMLHDLGHPQFLDPFGEAFLIGE